MNEETVHALVFETESFQEASERAWADYLGGLDRSGVLVSHMRLAPWYTATTVRWRNGQIALVDGTYEHAESLDATHGSQLASKTSAAPTTIGELSLPERPRLTRILVVYAGTTEAALRVLHGYPCDTRSSLELRPSLGGWGRAVA